MCPDLVLTIKYSAKNHNVQISIIGWKQVQSLSDGRVFVYTDGKNAKIRISGTFITSTSAGKYNLGTINSAYKPSENYSTNYSYAATLYAPVYLKAGETVVHLQKGSTSTANVSCYCTLYYPLGTPLY